MLALYLSLAKYSFMVLLRLLLSYFSSQMLKYSIYFLLPNDNPPLPPNSQTWKKTIFFTQTRFDPKLFYPKKCVNFDKIEFATKQRKCI